MSESSEDKLARVRAMATGDPSWMSHKEIEAIKAVLVKLDRRGLRITEHESRLKALLSYLATAHQDNTDAWMDGLAKRMNELLKFIGDKDRVRYVGSNLGGFIEVMKAGGVE